MRKSIDEIRNEYNTYILRVINEESGYNLLCKITGWRLSQKEALDLIGEANPDFDQYSPTYQIGLIDEIDIKLK